MTTQQQNTPHDEIAGEHRITSAEIDRLKDAANYITHRRHEQLRACQKARDSVLDEILEEMRRIQDHLSRMENTAIISSIITTLKP